MTVKSDTDIARAITDKRLLARLNQEEVASAIEVSTGTIWNWENGISQPNIRKVWQLADYYGCSMDELCGREPPNTQSITR